MSSSKVHKGSCFCGAVQFTLTGDPMLMGYCHCESCRHWSAGPVTAFTLWSPDAVTIDKGADNIATFNKTPASSRQWCKACGGHVFTQAPEAGFTDVYAVLIPSLPFEASGHVHYQETVLPIKDGLPKFKDLPADAGGSGKMLPE